MNQTFVVFFGPPGCGKGTQAQRAVEEFELAQISTGELFRKHLSEDTPLGLQAKYYMDQGALVPDDVTISMVRERLHEPDCENGAIFDGFPRTEAQAAALDKLLTDLGSELAMVINFELPIEVSRERLMGRQEGRADDSPEVIDKRLQDHADVEASVMPHYRAQPGLVKDLDANRSIEAIYEDVRTLIQSAMK